METIPNRSRRRSLEYGPASWDFVPLRRGGRGAYRPAGGQSGPLRRFRIARLARVCITMAALVAVVCTLAAPGIKSAAQHMTPSPIKSAAIGIGDVSVAVQNFLHLGWPWREFQAALGSTGNHQLSKGARHKNPTGGHKRTRSPRSNQPPPKWPKLRRISKKHPLNLMVTGDSLPQYMVYQITELAAKQGPVVDPAGLSVTFPSTGLVRPDFFPWPAQAGRETKQYHPDAVVMLLGGNDDQNMVYRGQVLVVGSRPWLVQYERRAVTVMRDFIQGGVRRVYWLSMFPAADAQHTWIFHLIAQTDRRAAAKVPGVRFVNIVPAITDDGKYTAYKKINGVETLIRTPDGIHLNAAGSQLVSNMVVPIVKREWHFGWSAIGRRNSAMNGIRHTRSDMHPS